MYVIVIRDSMEYSYCSGRDIVDCQWKTLGGRNIVDCQWNTLGGQINVNCQHCT